jgi:hypothetical protein
MAFDGAYVKERPLFNTIEDVWEYANDLGSKWFFYPFYFVISGNRIKDTPEELTFLKNKKVFTVYKLFRKLSEREDMQDTNVEIFISELLK